MKVIYIGPYDGITIPPRGITAQRGEETEVSADVGKSLVSGRDWTQATEKKKGSEER